MKDPYLTPKQLAALYNMPLGTIYKLVAAGTLPVKRLPGSRQLRFDLEEIEGRRGDSPVVNFPAKKRLA